MARGGIIHRHVGKGLDYLEKNDERLLRVSFREMVEKRQDNYLVTERDAFFDK